MEYPKKICIKFDDFSLELHGENAQDWYKYYRSISPNGVQTPIEFEYIKHEDYKLPNVLKWFDDHILYLILMLLLIFHLTKYEVIVVILIAILLLIKMYVKIRLKKRRK